MGVVSFTDNEPAFAAKENSPGTNYIPITLADKIIKRMRAAIDEARSLADLVVFSIHWGPTMRQKPTNTFREFAHAVIEMGVDIFHGHSSHIFQGIEIYGGKVIMYDTGEDALIEWSMWKSEICKTIDLGGKPVGETKLLVTQRTIFIAQLIFPGTISILPHCT